MLLKRGDFVQLTYLGQVKRAMVGIASPNGRSLMLVFEGLLRDRTGGVFVGSLPVLQDDDGQFRDLFDRQVAELSGD